VALMKLSKYYKGLGYEVELFHANLPYFPNRKKKRFIVPEGFDLYFCSIVFVGNYEAIDWNGQAVSCGGTGYDMSVVLHEDIENQECDYSIYDTDTSYGFISRGCIRNCSFCFVPRKEGKIRQVNTIENIVRHKKVEFLDNNFLALPNHKELLKQLIKMKLRFRFNTGIDIRLVDEENSELLRQVNYMGEYTFAFDDIKLMSLIEQKLELLKWRKDWQLRFYVYCNPDYPTKDVVDRVNWLKDRKLLPYLMRDITCWGSVNSHFYIDLAVWCNNPRFLKLMDFETFLHYRHKKINRINESLRIYNGE
jgi:hypothetical protein